LQLVSEELVVILPHGHALAKRHRLRMADLADEHFIAHRPGARLRELLVSAGRDAGFEPRVTLESNESQRIRRLVARGLGVAVLPRSDAEGPGADIAVAALIDPALTRDITLAWREGRRLAPAAAEFLELAWATFATQGVSTPPLRHPSAPSRGSSATSSKSPTPSGKVVSDTPAPIASRATGRLNGN
jgi:DNA-binding transcriptional LysR family regulator